MLVPFQRWAKGQPVHYIWLRQMPEMYGSVLWQSIFLDGLHEVLPIVAFPAIEFAVALGPAKSGPIRINTRIGSWTCVTRDL